MKIGKKLFIFIMLCYWGGAVFFTFYSKEVYDKNLPVVTVIRPKLTQVEKYGRNAFIIPDEAVNFDDLGFYIFVAREKNDVLGDNYTVWRVDISILEKNDGESTVDGIYYTEPVIIHSTKPIGSGSRVKLSEIG